MGKLLQIRVMAYTYRPEDVAETWPKLSGLVWPEPPAGPPEKERGVLELVQALEDGASFGDWSADVKKNLEPGLALALVQRRRLESALADWKASEANAASEQLEEALTDMEREAPAKD